MRGKPVLTSLSQITRQESQYYDIVVRNQTPSNKWFIMVPKEDFKLQEFKRVINVSYGTRYYLDEGVWFYEQPF